MASLAELFPEGDYRFHLTLRRGEPRAFFAPRDETGRILAERRRWLAAEPARYAALLPEGEPLLAEFEELCAKWGSMEAGRPHPASGAMTDGGVRPPWDRLLALGGAWEPDFLLLSCDEAGRFRLRGGALCFPTGWALEEKLGHPLEFIHGVVPGLNDALGAPIHQFLSRLKPETAFHRDNWGLATTAELNLHPARAMPAPAQPVALERLWLRIEHQALVALPRSGGVLFGIRIALYRLDEVARDRVAAAGLRRALATMPAELAAYKRIDAIRDELAGMLT
ncbi:MAG TPA: heme-dependent oxidative N-demethylase subunit alpha family protein [Opitutus sp.]|nr:heme-dependent oxidative N-demethylase subunit alpha family protein [Opitutus sp.]